MFELETLTKVRVLDVRVLASKDRKPDDPPGAQMLLQADLPADVLSMFDGPLKGQLFRRAAAAKQGTLDGIDSLERTTFAEHVKRFKWQYEQTGCQVTIDQGMGGKSNINLADCKAHRVLISPREGSVVVQWSLDAPALSDATRGKLTGLKATEIQMTQFAPVADTQQSIEPAPKAKTQAKDATDTFADGEGPDGPDRDEDGEADSEGGEPDADAEDTLEARVARGEPTWPFPKDGASEAPPQSVTVETSRPGTRTARGREQTAKAIAAKSH